jgi:hypothetical protein
MSSIKIRADSCPFVGQTLHERQLVELLDQNPGSGV